MGLPNYVADLIDQERVRQGWIPPMPGTAEDWIVIAERIAESELEPLPTPILQALVRQTTRLASYGRTVDVLRELRPLFEGEEPWRRAYAEAIDDALSRVRKAEGR
jgi:hypothetical protein